MADKFLSEPLPLVQTSGKEAAIRAFGAGGQPDPSTPLGAAALWHAALCRGVVQYRAALRSLSYAPDRWGDFSAAVKALAHRSMLTRVDAPEDRTDISYVRFIEYDGATNAMIFADTPLHDVVVLTLVRPARSPHWLVFGMTQNWVPSPADLGF